MFKAIVCTVIIVFSAQAENIQKRENALKECLTENALEHNYVNEENAPINITCVKKCVLEKMNLVNASGDPIETSYNEKDLKFLKTCDEKTKNHPPCFRVDAFDRCMDESRRNQTKLFNEECREEKDYWDVNVDVEIRQACFRKCVAIKEGLLLEDGEIHVEGMKEIVSEKADVGELVEECKREFNSSTGCQKAIDVMHCVIEKGDVFKSD